MGIHQERTHPVYDPDCFVCRVSTVTISAAATPNSRPQAAASILREKRLNKDLPAYARLRKNGVQPRRTAGAAKVEALANSNAEIVLGKRLGNQTPAYERVASDLGMDLTKAVPDAGF